MKPTITVTLVNDELVVNSMNCSPEQEELIPDLIIFTEGILGRRIPC